MSVNRGIWARKRAIRERNWEIVAEFIAIKPADINQIFALTKKKNMGITLTDLRNLMAMNKNKCECVKRSGIFVWKLKAQPIPEPKERAEFEVATDLPDSIKAMFGLPVKA